MQTMDTSPFDTPIEGLLATPTSRLPYQHNVLLRSFVLQRPQGNVIIYNSPGVNAAAAAIRDLGGAARLLINHSHEAMYGQPEFDVPVWVHRRDRAEVAHALRISGVFEEPAMVDDDLEIIPTPGHTPGTTSYLWDNGDHRFLFTGDFIWIEEGEWKAVVLDPGLRHDYVRSLKTVRNLDFDILVPWGTTDDGPSYAHVPDPSEVRERIDAIIGRVEAGTDR